MLAQEKQVYKWLLIRWISFINQGHTNIFKVNLLQWYLFTKPYRFPVYNSIKHLHTALCAITPSKVFLSLFSTPLPTSNIHTPCSSAPFPLAIPLLICVYTKNPVCIGFLATSFTFFHSVPQISLSSDSCQLLDYIHESVFILFLSFIH